jgi:hypothetical protein
LEFPTKPHPQRAGFQASTEERLLSADDIRSLSAPRAGGRWRKREGCGTLPVVQLDEDELKREFEDA